MTKTTVGNYLLSRLKELNIEHIFGVAGDFNLGFVTQIHACDGIEWVPTCNELNGSYAADGYARIKGAGAVLTTFGVGELCTVNGVAGAYAEHVALVNIVGIPTTDQQSRGEFTHHTFADGRFDIYPAIFKHVTVDQAILTHEDPGSEIDRVLTLCWQQKRPVYIALPKDLQSFEIEARIKPLNLAYPSSSKDALLEIISRVVNLVTNAKSPVILVDMKAQRFHMQKMILDFLNKTGLPFATMNMGKSVIDESHPGFIGIYSGKCSSSDSVRQQIENSDCVIAFGLVLSDLNTGEFSAQINLNTSIEIQNDSVRIQQAIYNNVYFNEAIPAITQGLANYRHQGEFVSYQTQQTFQAKDISIKQSRFWSQVATHLSKNQIILADMGTSICGALTMTTQENTDFICGFLWCSLGYTVAATLGACLAAPDKQVMLFIGDGGFQMTAQEISTIQRHNLSPLVFLLDNNGYTIERIGSGDVNSVDAEIQHWDYMKLPHIFADNAYTAKVKTETELETAIADFKRNDNKLGFIQVIMESSDCPELLLQLLNKN